MYVGNLNKTQFSIELNQGLSEYMKEVKELRKDVAELKTLLNKQNKELMTINEVAEYLSITPATVHTHANKGKLIRHKVGSHTLFKKEEVDKLINLSKK